MPPGIASRKEKLNRLLVAMGMDGDSPLIQKRPTLFLQNHNVELTTAIVIKKDMMFKMYFMVILRNFNIGQKQVSGGIIAFGVMNPDL